MGRDARDSQASPLVPRGRRRESRDLLERYDRELGRRAERSVTLRAEAPHPLTQEPTRHALSHDVDSSRPVTVRDDSRVRHPDAEGVPALLGVAGVDARAPDRDADLTRAGKRVLHRTDDEDLPGLALGLVPRCSHGWIPPRKRVGPPTDRFSAGLRSGASAATGCSPARSRTSLG